MHIALPTQKTARAQFAPALVAALLFALGAVVIPTSYPVDVSEGVISPAVAKPGEKVEVRWRQDWNKLCPLTVTREFVGMDTFKKTAARMEYDPPAATGSHDYRGTLIIPELPPGQAYYHSIIEPHCWIDALWQRTYKTPDLPVLIVPTPPPGPR